MRWPHSESCSSNTVVYRPLTDTLTSGIVPPPPRAPRSSNLPGPLTGTMVTTLSFSSSDPPSGNFDFDSPFGGLEFMFTTACVLVPYSMSTVFRSVGARYLAVSGVCMFLCLPQLLTGLAPLLGSPLVEKCLTRIQPGGIQLHAAYVHCLP